ncbi:tetratricopeptide (TPR) repeat protein [Amorphus suaedae]
MMPTVDDRLAAASSHLAQNRPEAAEAIFRDVLQQDPRSARAMAGLGAVLLQRGLVDEAFEFLGRATTLDPKNADPYRNLSVVYRARGEPANALACLEAANALEPDRVDTLLGMAETLVALDRHDESVPLIEKAHALEPDSVPVLIALGGLHTLRGDLPKAISCYHRAAELAPDSPEAHANLATLYGTTGRPKEALEHAERAQLAEPVNPGFVSVLAGALEETGDIARALGLVRHSLILHPHAVLLHCRLASLELAGGAADQALAGLARMLKERRDDPALLETMTLLLHRAGRPEQALAAARELLRNVPGAAHGRRIERHALMTLGRHAEVWPATESTDVAGAQILVQLTDSLPVLEAVTLLRAIPLARARGATVRVLAPSFLAPLATCITHPETAGDGGRRTEKDTQAWLEAAEKVPLLALPARAGLSDADLLGSPPYLVPAPEKAAMWRQALEAMPKPWIGFTWAAYRPGPRVEEMRALLARTGGTPISLVWDQNRVQLSVMPEAIDAGLHIQALDDLIAAVSALDAVVGIDGLPIHVAGALGKPGVAVIPKRQLWYWRTDEAGSSIWYNSIRPVERAPGTAWETSADSVEQALSGVLAASADATAAG